MPWTSGSKRRPSSSISKNRGLEDNTFTNGLGRDTTLIGSLLNAYLQKRLFSSLELDVGVFANMPFGHDTEVSQVRPIVRLNISR